MVKDDRKNVAPRGGSTRGGEVLGKVLLAAAVACAAAGLLAYRWLRAPDFVAAQADPPRTPTRTVPLFHYWPTDRKPDAVLLLTGEQFGYNKPCGCSEPQYGGVDRRWNFVQRELRSRGWPIVALDLGDVAQKNSPQAILKYVYSMRALKRMGYTALGLGGNEFAIPIQDALANFYLNEKDAKTGRPFALAANLHDYNGPNYINCVNAYCVNKDTGIAIGVVGLIGPSVAHKVKDPSVSFDEIGRNGPKGPQLTDLLPGVVRDMSQKEQPELLVLLYQGSLEEARSLASHYNKFAVILSLSAEEEPREEPLKVGSTLIVNVGHKGRKVGVLGIYRSQKDGKPFEFHYQLCSIGPEYETPKGDEKDNPMIALLEDYAREVKAKNLLAQHIRSKHRIQTEPGYEQSFYVGSEKCKSCHPASYQVWKASPHSHAYHSLEKAKRPGLQQYDPECVRCHVTGLDHFGGFTDEAQTPHLKDNGCENCHGPASMHIKNKNDTRLHALMNPFKTKPNETAAERQRRVNALNDSCRKCHDDDNDVHWDISKWEKGKIFHQEPKDGANVPPVPAGNK